MFKLEKYNKYNDTYKHDNECLLYKYCTLNICLNLQNYILNICLNLQIYILNICVNYNFDGLNTCLPYSLCDTFGYSLAHRVVARCKYTLSMLIRRCTHLN